MLEYIGGGRFLLGVPARDLSEEDIKSLKETEMELIKSGLYKKTRKEVEHGPIGIQENSNR